MATTNRDGESHAARVRFWQALFAGAVSGAILGIIVALLVVHGDSINFGDLPTWLLVAAAVWAGAIALRQLREQQTELSRIREHQLAADNLLALQLSEATKTAATSVHIQVTEVAIPLLGKVPGVEPLRVGAVVNAGGVPIRDVVVRRRANGQLQPPVELNPAGAGPAKVEVLAPGASTFFNARNEGAVVRWSVRFTDVTGQSWEIQTDGEPARVSHRDW